MRRLSRVLLFGVLASALVGLGCGGSAPAETEGEETVDEQAPPSPEAVAAAERLTSRLGTVQKLVPTVRGLAEVGYEQPNARRDGNFIVTRFKVKNLAENAIAGLQVDEFWFDRDGNTVTGDSMRFREPVLSGQVVEIELRVPRDPAMDRSNYEFSHQNGEIKATLLESIEDPVEEEADAEADAPASR